MTRFIQKIASRLLHRDLDIDGGIPLPYLAGVAIRYFWALCRSLRYIFGRNIAVGRIFIEPGVVIRCVSKVCIAPGVRLGSGVYIDGFGQDGIIIGSGASIGAQSRIICSGSLASPGRHVIIGERVGIGEFSRIGGSGGVEIGSDTIIAQYFSAHPENHNFADKQRLIRAQGTTKAPIVIGKNCWIGAKVTVTAGVTIGDGVVIGSGAVVAADIPSFSVAAGVPARVLKRY